MRSSPPARGSRAVPVFVLLLAAACGPSGQGAARPMTRTYYVAAEEVEWDFTPSGRNLISNADWDEVQRPFVTAGDMHVGHLARKAIYREYTDSTFSTLKPRPAEWEHLGIMGPLLRGVVGDTIRVVFLNRATFPASMHPHGVFYLKDSEGAPYADGTDAAAKLDDGVTPGAQHIYIWPVPERAGPSHDEGSTAFWMYHSHTSEVGDVNAGLIGPMIITARAKARPDATPTDVDRELIVGFLEFDETNSTLWEENLRTYGKPPAVLKPDLVFGERQRGPGNAVRLQGDAERPPVREYPRAVNAGGGSGAMVPDGVDQLRDPRTTLAREHRPSDAHDDRRCVPPPDGHARGGHGAR